MNKNERNISSSDRLRTFVMIAECGNLTHAAARLHRTQSAVSVQLKNLEEELSVRLFDRLSRGMSLNENGKKLLPVAERMLADMRNISMLFEAPLKGRIRVGIPDDFDGIILERALAEFSNNNRDVEVIARSGCTSGFEKDVRRGELDIAVCSGPDIVEGEVLSSVPTVWACCETMVVDKKSPVPLAVLDRNCWWGDMPARALEENGMKWNAVFQSSSFPSLKSSIRAGLSVSALPKTSVEPGMRILTTRDGFPSLPPSKRTILVRPAAAKSLTSAMAKALNSAVLRG